MAEGDEGGGGGGQVTVIVRTQAYKSLNAIAGAIAMQLFVNSNFESSNGIASKTPEQASQDAVARALLFVEGPAKELLQDLIDSDDAEE